MTDLGVGVVKSTMGAFAHFVSSLELRIVAAHRIHQLQLGTGSVE